MSLPSPFLNSNKEMVPLSKGVPPIKSYQRAEFFKYEVFVDGRREHVSQWFPLTGIPEGFMHLNSKENASLTFKLWIESWRFGVPYVTSVRTRFPYLFLVKSGKVQVSLPGQSSAFLKSVRKARLKVSLSRQGKLSRRGNQRSSPVRPNPELVTKFVTVFNEGNNGGYFLQAFPSSYLAWSRSWIGFRTPGFSKLKKKQLPVNPHAVQITEIQDGLGAFLNFIPSTGIYFNQFTKHTTMYAAPPAYAGHLPGARFKALRKLIDEAQSGIQANIAQDFAQIGQTVTMIADTAKRVSGALIALKNGNIPGAVKSLWRTRRPRYNGSKLPKVGQNLANNWLALQYGWKPLLQDVKESMAALARLNVGSQFVHRATGSATVDLLKESDIKFRLDSNQLAGKTYFYQTTRAKYTLRYKVDDNLKAFLAQTGFTNPLNLGWEVLPFSFVVDWFVPLGPFLETLSAWDGLKFVDGSVTDFSRETVFSSVGFAGITPSAPGQQFQDISRWSRKTVHLSRSLLNEMPTALMPSGFNNGLASITHATNALALMRSLFK